MQAKNLLYLGVLVLAGCSTKVDLNTEWEDTTIVYGILDQKEEYHYVRINKAFLGTGDYYSYAQIRDSSEYSNVNAYIEELNNGVVVNTYPLRDTLMYNRDLNGVFYAPEQKVYYFKNTSLNTNRKYRFTAVINEGTTKEKTVTGETELVNDFTPPSINTIALGTFDGSTGEHFLTQTIKFIPPSNSDNYEVLLRLQWDDYYPGDTVRRSYLWSVGESDRSQLVSGAVAFDVKGEAFFKTISNAVTRDAAIYRRVFRSVDILIYAASDDLATYININKPQSGLVQERPEFTNMGNGLGLFSSRTHVELPNRPLSIGSYRELVMGSYTSDLHFCTDTTAVLYASDPDIACP